jgi:hypothetical protein
MREQREWQRLIDNPQQTLDSTERHALLFCKENRAFGGVAWLILTYNFRIARTKIAQERELVWLGRAYPNVNSGVL